MHPEPSSPTPPAVSVTSDQSTVASTASASLEVIPAADLSIDVTDGVDSIAPGSTDTYTITLTNNGPSEAPDATVTEAITPGFSAVSDIESIGGTTYTDLGGGQFQWTGIDLVSGSSATLTLVGNVPSPLPAGGTRTSLASVSLYPGEIDTNPVDHAVDADVVTGTATSGSLGVAIASYDGDSVTATPSESALAGSDVTEELTLSNTTDGTESNVVVPVDLPANFTLQSGSVSPSAGATVLTAGILTWTVPSIAAGSSDTLSYTETTDAPGTFESDPTAVSVTSDQSTVASTASASLEVIPAADLSIDVTDGVDSIAPGSTDTYTITLTNNGPSTVTNATVSDTLNGGFTPLFVVSSIGGTTFVDLGPDQFEWTGIDLASGATATFDMMGDVSSSLAPGNAFVNLASGWAAAQEVDTDSVHERHRRRFGDPRPPIDQLHASPSGRCGPIGDAVGQWRWVRQPGRVLRGSLERFRRVQRVGYRRDDARLPRAWDVHHRCQPGGERELCRGPDSDHRNSRGAGAGVQRRHASDHGGSRAGVRLHLRCRWRPRTGLLAGSGRAVVARHRCDNRWPFGHAPGGHDNVQRTR